MGLSEPVSGPRLASRKQTHHPSSASSSQNPDSPHIVTFQAPCTRRGGDPQPLPAQPRLQPDAGRVLHPLCGRHLRLSRLRRVQGEQGQGAVGAVHRGTGVLIWESRRHCVIVLENATGDNPDPVLALCFTGALSSSNCFLYQSNHDNPHILKLTIR